MGKEGEPPALRSCCAEKLLCSPASSLLDKQHPSSSQPRPPLLRGEQSWSGAANWALCGWGLLVCIKGSFPSKSDWGEGSVCAHISALASASFWSIQHSTKSLNSGVPTNTHILPSCSPANLPAWSHMSLIPITHQHEDRYICMHTRYRATQPKHDSMAELME